MPKIGQISFSAIPEEKKQTSKAKETFIGKTIRSILLSMPKMKAQPTQDTFEITTQTVPEQKNNIQEDRKIETTQKRIKENSDNKPKAPTVEQNSIPKHTHSIRTEIEPVSAENSHSDYGLFTISDDYDKEDSIGFTAEINENYYEDYWAEAEARRKREEEDLLLLAGTLDILSQSQFDFDSPLFPSFLEGDENPITDNDSIFPSSFGFGFDDFNF